MHGWGTLEAISAMEAVLKNLASPIPMPMTLQQTAVRSGRSFTQARKTMTFNA